jgi:FlaG/FlaF family flagellin (archaellin)
MSLLTKLNKKKNRKGLSIVVGYVLLIAISIVMSVIVFVWLRTYVPKDTMKCPDGTSVFIKDISYNCASKVLTVTLKNNGKFSVNGYFIHVSNKTNEELATIDLSSRIMSGGNVSGNAITFSLDQNSLTPTEPTNSKISLFNVTGYGTLYKLEIIPTRFQEEDEKMRFVSCGDAKVEETLTCT